MEKKIIKEIIFRKHYDGKNADVFFGDLPIDLKPDDIINIIREDSYFSENNSYDEYTVLEIERGRKETDEEFNKRKNISTKQKEEDDKRRYEIYLKLKKEFENE